MTDRSDPRLEGRCSKFVHFAARFSVAVGLSALAGWRLHILSLITWGAKPVTTKANTALLFVLTGTSLWFLRREDFANLGLRKVTGNALAIVACLIATATLLEGCFGWNFGIDQLLIVPPPAMISNSVRPGLMSPISATAFLLIGLALLAINYRTRRGWWLAQFLAGAAGCAATLSIFEFAFDAQIYIARVSLALPTAATLIVLSWGIMVSRPQLGVGALLCRRDISGRLARRLLPALLIPVLAGGMRWEISGTRYYSEWTSVVLISLTTLLLLLTVVARVAMVVQQGDTESSTVEAARQLSAEQLDRLLDRVGEAPAEARLRRRVRLGFSLAVLLIAILGFVSWRSAVEANTRADWVAHTHEVSATLEATLRNSLDVETADRGFALTGTDAFLETFVEGKKDLERNLARLGVLVAENPAQSRRLAILNQQVKAKIEVAEAVIAVRQYAGAVPSPILLDRGREIMEAIRVSVTAMEAEQERLLEERSRRSLATRRRTGVVITIGSTLGVLFLALAGFGLSREIGISARARAQVDILNLNLERRVLARTAELGESEHRLAGIIQSAMDAILTVDERQSIVLFNAAAEKMFGCTAAEAVGQSVLRFIPQRFHSANPEHIDRFGATGVTARAMGSIGDVWGVRANGEEFQIEASISHLKAPKKMFTVILRDVTERNRIQELLRQKEHLLSESQRIAHVGSWTFDLHDPQQRIVWSEELYRIYGVTPRTFLPTVDSFLSLIVPEDRSKMQNWIGACVRGEDPGDFEFRVKLPDGAIRFINGRGELERDAQHQPVRIVGSAQDITDRKLAEQALRESEARFLAMVNGIPQLAWMADGDGNIFWYNQRWYDYTGTTPEEMEGWGWQRVHDPAVLPLVLRRWKESIASGAPFEMEFPLLAADGLFGDFLTRIVPLKDGEGRVVRWFGTNTDISVLKKAEEALRQQSRVLDLAQVLVRDMEGRIVLWNRGAEELYGFTREEAVGRVSHELLRTEFPAAVGEIEEQMRLAGKWEGELKHYKRDGSCIVVSSLWMLHRDDRGQAIGVLEANVDITARKAAERELANQAEELVKRGRELSVSREALEAQTAMLQLVLDNMGEGLIAADEDGHFLIWNNAACQLMGRAAEDLAIQEWTPHYQVFLPDGITPYPSESLPLARALRGESVSVELLVCPPGREKGVFLEVAARPLKDARGDRRGGVAVLRDITGRKADQREIQQLNEELEIRVQQRTLQLEAANKELESFSYSVSHDLRAPLRHISGFSQMLLEEFGESLEPAARRYLDRIQAGTEKMGQLVDELLNLARVGRHALNLSTTDLNATVADVIAMLEVEIAGRQVEWRITDQGSVDCDPVLVKQIFQNLLANALKFTRGQSTAVIEVVRSTGDDGQTVFVVRDNGVGFNMKYVDKLFGVFQRLHREEDFEGTGIGLATVQRIVRKHGGRVWAESEPGKGAAFYFTLPRETSDSVVLPGSSHAAATAGETGFSTVTASKTSATAGGQS